MGISNHFKLPNRKRKLLTKEFLETFKNELDEVFHDGNEIDLSERNYINTYQHMEDTIGFNKALKTTCEKYNLIKAIYEYGNKLPCNSDFDGRIMDIMIEKGMIEEGSLEDMYDYTEDEIRWTRNGVIQWYKSIIQHKGYNIISYNSYWTDEEIRKDLYSYKLDNEIRIPIEGLPPHLLEIINK